MNEDERGYCRKRRGRPRVCRTFSDSNVYRCYAPVCNQDRADGDPITILPEEIEVLRLVDLLDYNQEEAAGIIGVSRKTLWRDLHEARRKVAEALVYGRMIRISGCMRRDDKDCPRNNP
ncbi:putative DNA-binding protein (UPF0251 family) [Methanocalculus alkaliphilus]|uniref:DUF134 domain-containing protein n=1 Tax=Methanocalculus alkaliphilus TaxID=768730 RepID=UPI0020A0CCBB|nr:DUF134 domain-containing protein [Methanocalculus alkaliphilus]MCP1714199.1 putative DNA-binding protein (UPF0251 family) [Methanocalculus alkaliphilus]